MQMLRGLGTCVDVTNGVGTDRDTGETCVVTSAPITTVNVPATGGAVYYDAAGNKIQPLTVATPTWINGVSNNTVMVIAAVTVGVILLARAR